MTSKALRSTWARAAVAATASVMLLGVAGVAIAETSKGADAAKPLSLKVMTYNVCSNSKGKDLGTDHARCDHGRSTKKVAEGIRKRMGKQDGLKAVLLQEICSADIDHLNGLSGLKKWKFEFRAIKDRGEGKKPGKLRERRCADDSGTGHGRGHFGIGVGVRTHHVDFRAKNFSDKNSPDKKDNWGSWGVRQAVMCADVAGWKATLCGVHLTPLKDSDPDHPNEFWKAQAAQARLLREYAEARGSKHVVYGGDLNQYAPDGKGGYGDKSTVAPLYETHIECDQSSSKSKRDGHGTFQLASGEVKHKIDYLFASRGAKTSCHVPGGHVAFADHLPLTGTFTFS